MVTKLNFTEQIKKAIEQTALNRKDESIVTAEDMIPKMDHAKYQNKILDIPYGGRTQKEKLDIYYPETGDGPRLRGGSRGRLVFRAEELR